MAQTLPVATYLCTINQEKTLSFLYQGGPGGSQKESLHILSTCPKFHYARTAAHNQVLKGLAASLSEYLAGDWYLCQLVPTAVVLQSGGQVLDSGAQRSRYAKSLNI